MRFEGKYRGVEEGRERLEELRSDVQRLLRGNTSAAPRELSTRWRGIKVRTAVRRYVPLWILFVAAAFIMLTGYNFIQWRLSDELAQLEQLLAVIGHSGPP